jgi:hypothetical protein
VRMPPTWAAVRAKTRRALSAFTGISHAGAIR